MNWLRRKLAEWFHRPLIHVGYGDIVLYDGVREDDNSQYAPHAVPIRLLVA